MASAEAATLTVTTDLDAETRELLKKPVSLGDRVNGSKKFVMSLATVLVSGIVIVMTHETSPELADAALKWGVFGGGAGGLGLTFLHDWLKSSSKGKQSE